MTKKPSEPSVRTRSTGAVTVITLNRPETLNSVDRAMAVELQAALRQVSRDPRCRCLVLTGSGRAFCAGQALPSTNGSADLPEDIEGLIQDRYVPIVTGLRALMIPVVAAVNGLATGAGFSLSLAADIRVASDASWFSCGFAQIGLVPDAGATYFLPRFLGLSHSLQLALTGDRLSPKAAMRLGLVARVYPQDTFEEKYLEFANALAEGPTAAFGRTKRSLAASLESGLDEQLAREASLQQASSLTDDFQEGLRAFKERRPPQFSGR